MEGWKDTPENRGTMQILWLCLSTLGLCAWTAVHPNIVLSPRSSSFKERLGMMALAIVFPEIILSSAWAQLWTAKNLFRQVNDCRSERSCQVVQRHLSL